MNQKIAEAINTLGIFCGKRDLPTLTKEELQKKYGIEQADVLVLFGGSILCGGDVLAQAIKENVAKHYLIVGGEGHTTQSLRDRVHAEYPQIETDGLPEAKVFEAYLKEKYDLAVDYLECNSTNCGNNITYLLDTLNKHCIEWNSIILMQDATMQHRMEAGLRKHLEDGQYQNGDDYIIINFASYKAKVVCVRAKAGEAEAKPNLIYENDIYGMWDMDRYITLLMGEIPRLTDDENGYGPRGKNFIAHVDIPKEVREAFELLNEEYKGYVREANSAYASK
ncbi:MAG: YdcF family protein [Lachnospiraceae bacterium]|nr:YdcF family protein [Lachnospiraceae bacterium]